MDNKAKKKAIDLKCREMSEQHRKTDGKMRRLLPNDHDSLFCWFNWIYDSRVTLSWCNHKKGRILWQFNCYHIGDNIFLVSRTFRQSKEFNASQLWQMVFFAMNIRLQYFPSKQLRCLLLFISIPFPDHWSALQSRLHPLVFEQIVWSRPGSVSNKPEWTSQLLEYRLLERLRWRKSGIAMFL